MSKILILDDNVDILDATALLLKSRGYEVQISSNIEAFFELQHSFKPEVVIIDILLQGTDGRELCGLLRRDAANEHLCILLFSASPVMMEDFVAYGADGCMEKPFEMSGLIDTIENCLLSRRSRLKVN